jgi:predicted metal-dependent enzyme (double-stranded beta helix superfamily)
MDTLVRMNAEEINMSFIDFIKTSFKGKKIALHIYEEDIDETEFLLKSHVNEKRLYQSIDNVKNNINLKEINFSDLQQILNDDGK